MSNHRFFLLTGEPGVGKTTLTKKLCGFLNEKGVKTAGFYTEEVRRNGVREGFDVVTLSGRRGRLARDQRVFDYPKYKNKSCAIGKYGVFVKEFEDLSQESLDMPQSDTVLVIDEIGKMELFSQPFIERCKDIFTSTSDNIVLATIPLRSHIQFIDVIKSHQLSICWMVTKENRDTLVDIISEEMLRAIKIKCLNM